MKRDFCWIDKVEMIIQRFMRITSPQEQLIRNDREEKTGGLVRLWSRIFLITKLLKDKKSRSDKSNNQKKVTLSYTLKFEINQKIKFEANNYFEKKILQIHRFFNY